MINITTRAPTEDFEAEMRARYGNGNERKLCKLFGAISGPLIGDWLLFRVSGSHREFGGLNES